MDVHFDWTFLFIPLISAFVGWGTNVIAVKMMFYPVRFVGLRPIFGWQGIVPANAVELARKSTDIITSKLINLPLLFKDFDPKEFTQGNLARSLDDLADRVIVETVAEYAPEPWERAPEPVKEQVRQLVRGDLEKVAVAILADVSEDIDSIIDLQDIVVAAAERDRKIVGDMFETVGANEFEFIRRSGAYFGFLFGFVQLAAWMSFPAWWVLPFFGFFVGYVTNFLAIKLIFQPAEPRRVGPFTVQGLFHKRQREVSEGFSRMVAADILSADNIMAYMTSGAAGERLFGIIERRANEMLDRYSQNPMVQAMAPDLDWDEVRAELDGRFRAELQRKPDGFLYVFAARAIDIYNELFDKMAALDANGFEGIIRPPFQKDEWKLILAGAVLGLGAGVLQVAFLFSGHL
jgi:uncharacterized membrane protein YheB (UPF0754 family)